MFCPNCGQENREDANFCESCGAPLPKKRKKKTLLVVLLVIVALLAAGGVAAALNFAVVSNFVMRSFAPPARYYQFVMARTAVGFSEEFSDIFGGGLDRDMDLNDFREDITLDFSLSDDAMELIDGYFNLSESLPGGLDWLRQPGLRMSVSRKDYLASLRLGLALQNKEILDGLAITDAEAETLWAAVPALNDRSMALDASEGFDALRQRGTSLRELFDSVSAAPDYAPDKVLLARVAARYFLLLTEDLGAYEKGRGALGVGDVNATDYGWINLNVSEENLRALLTRLCAALREDPDVRTLVENYGKAASRSGLYADFLNAVDDLAARTADIKLKEDIRLFLWVNSRGVLRGFELGYQNDSLLAQLPVRGKDFGLMVGYTDGNTDVTLFGTGSKDGKKLSGRFTLSQDEEELLSLELRDVESGAGAFTLKPAMELYRRMDIPSSQARMLENLSLSGSYSWEKNRASAHFDLLWQDTAPYVGVDYTLSVGASGGIEAPREAVEPSAWLGGITAEKLSAWTDTLKEAGVPGELADQLQTALMYLVWMDS